MSDTRPPSNHQASQFQPVAELLHALRFLTRLPLPLARTMDLPPLAQSMRMFSAAGALIGLIMGGVLVALRYTTLPPLLSGIIACALGLLLTGALHEDGLADMVDGFGGGKTRDQRLAIMRDSHIGSYGVLALGLCLMARAVAYASLLPLSTPALLWIMVASQSFSRAMMVDLIWATSPARTDGLAVYAGRPTRNMAVFAILVGLGLTLLTSFHVNPESSVIALAAALATTAIIRWQAVRLIGGQTGDVCGAVQVMAEIAMLLAFLAMNH